MARKKKYVWDGFLNWWSEVPKVLVSFLLFFIYPFLLFLQNRRSLDWLKCSKICFKLEWKTLHSTEIFSSEYNILKVISKESSDLERLSGRRHLKGTSPCLAPAKSPVHFTHFSVPDQELVASLMTRRSVVYLGSFRTSFWKFSIDPLIRRK